MTDSLSLLQLYVEWGADEALSPVPVDRLAQPQAKPPPPIQRARDEEHHFSRSPPSAPAMRPSRPAPPPSAATTAELAAADARDRAARATTVEELHIAMATFGQCALRDTATHTVTPQGRPGAHVMVVGEAPDADEDRGGMAFCGETGKLTDRMFGSIGLSRDDLFLAPVIAWRPPGGRPPSAMELKSCLPFLQRLIVLARPRRLILMGNIPVALLTGERITAARARGRWRDITVPENLSATGNNSAVPHVIPALPMRHAQQLRASPTARRDAWKDMLELRKTLQEDGYNHDA
ncbi:uracil-DNA glycosylase [Novacetimonas hansenii]|uniref:uracil-DNA glycosylase n=1 Tax=Novacetimonas hansenii TaxID=436 RepID=UPI00094F7B40|nr:uracil-DNA glycosylase [Novacetimonas hansenii]